MAVARVERRLTAILAADVVGYSRLIEQDEAATLAAIRALRAEVIDPLLTEHGGRVAKLMGDGAIVEFASVVDAVACAVAVQKAVALRQGSVDPEFRIVFRIGVNLGDVVVEGDDLLGDGVNIAARLEQICDPGGVLVSGTAYDHLKGKLDLVLEPRGEQRLKNIERAGAGLSGGAGSSATRSPPRHGQALPMGAAGDRGARRAGAGWWGLVAVAGRAGECRALDRGPAVRQSRRRRGHGPARGRAHRGHHHRPRPLPRPRRDRAQLHRGLSRHTGRRAQGRHRPGRRLCAGRLDSAPGRPCARHRPADRRAQRRPRLVGALGSPGGGRVRHPDGSRRAGRQHAGWLRPAYQSDRRRRQAQAARGPRSLRSLGAGLRRADARQGGGPRPGARPCRRGDREGPGAGARLHQEGLDPARSGQVQERLGGCRDRDGASGAGRDRHRSARCRIPW